MSISAVTITPALYSYVVEHSLRQDPHLLALYHETAALPAGKMISSPEQVQLLAMLLKLMQAERVLELGTFTGYTTLALAKALPSHGKITTCDIQAKFRHIGQHYWELAGVLGKIESVVMPALSYLDELMLATEVPLFDLAYVDADKKNYHAYYEKLLTLVRPGGLIVIDNVLWAGEVINPQNQESNTLAIRHFNELLHKDERVEVCMLPLGDGITLARVR